MLSCWEEKICWILEDISEELRWDIRLARLGDNLGQSKRRKKMRNVTNWGVCDAYRVGSRSIKVWKNELGVMYDQTEVGRRK